MLEFGRETPVLGACLSGYFMNRRVPAASWAENGFLEWSIYGMQVTL